MSVRTNNSTGSVHAHLNPKVSGKLSLARFLCIIEGQMRRNRIGIREGCISESTKVQREKNLLLALELEKLFNGREGLIVFLDNCSSIMLLNTLRQTRSFIRTSAPTPSDKMWYAGHRNLIDLSARRLFQELVSTGQPTTDSDILGAISDWSFQMLQTTNVVTKEESVLSLVENESRSFLALRETVKEQVLGPCPHENGDEHENEISGSEEFPPHSDSDEEQSFPLYDY